MTKILVHYYSMYGHIEIMAKAVAEGVRSANADVVMKRVPDTMTPEVAKQYGAKLEQEAPFATPDELPQYDTIIFQRMMQSALNNPIAPLEFDPAQRIQFFEAQAAD